LVGAPNNAPSLRSVAGLLLALALQSAYEDTLPPSLSECAWNQKPHELVRARYQPISLAGSEGSALWAGTSYAD